MTVDQQFNQLNEKLQQLLRQHARLKKENEQLKKEVADQQLKDNGEQERIRTLEQQVSILKFAAGNMSDEEKKAFEKEINRYLREIDKCIGYLGKPEL